MWVGQGLQDVQKTKEKEWIKWNGRARWKSKMEKENRGREKDRKFDEEEVKRLRILKNRKEQKKIKWFVGN